MGQRGYFTENKEPVVHLNNNRKREARAAYRFSTGGVYEGEWIGNMRDGFGKMTWLGVYNFY
jgi:hypothetical protein